jgi:hypothetical protein
MSTSTLSSPKKLNSAPLSPNPNSPNQNQEIDPTTIITDAVHVSVVSPSSTKKKISKRSKR